MRRRAASNILPGSNLEREERGMKKQLHFTACFLLLRPPSFAVSLSGKGAKRGELDFCCNAINLDWQKHLPSLFSPNETAAVAVTLTVAVNIVAGLT